MLKNYLKIAFRNILRNKVYSFISIAGLAVGMAACITIFVYVQHEYSYDSFNKKSDRIYRATFDVNIDGKTVKVPVSPPTLGPFLMSHFPEIEHTVRLYGNDLTSSSWGNPVLKYGQKVLNANRFLLVDSTFLDVFSFKMVEGDPKTALDAPFSVVVTKGSAQKLFGSENPIGKTILYNNNYHFTVTGVVENPPGNSTIQFDYLGSLNSISQMPDQPRSPLGEDYTYVLLKKGTNARELETQLQKVLDGFWGERFRMMFGLHLPVVDLQPLRDIYWNNSFMFDFGAKGSKSSTVAFSVIAIVILLIACANFVNLSTARSLTRAREVGIRKVVGGHRKQLVGQFLLESALMSLVALVTAVALSELLIPGMNRLLGSSLHVDYFHNLNILFVVICIWALTCLLSGIIPSFYLSSFQPASTLKGNTNAMTGGRLGRQFFILFQFSAAIALIFCTIVVARQYDLLRFKNIGFDRDNVVVLKYDQKMNGDYEPFKQKLLQNPHILGVTAGQDVPGDLFSDDRCSFRTKSRVENSDFNFAIVDPDYIPTLGMKMAAGRNFSWAHNSDMYNSYILNEAAVRKIGWTPQEAIGQPFGASGYPADSLKGRVVGVVADFNYEPLRYNVKPLVLLCGNWGLLLALRVSPTDLPETMGYIQKTWKNMFPNSPIDYNFLNKSLDALYKSEEKSSTLFSWFSALSIAIACLGLYGLVLYTAERRTKEIGIRKVLGASMPEILRLLTSEFIRWVVIANVIAWPLAYFIMNKWLQNFAYRINIGVWIFVASGLVALMIALATVSLQALRAATANPVESLRYE